MIRLLKYNRIKNPFERLLKTLKNVLGYFIVKMSIKGAFCLIDKELIEK